ncbi:MAG: alpha/beta hydrolase, partial [Aeromicrobium sp.]|nr:alpha/beta hydrolase [Aeromicrobium sp.]
DQLAEDAIRHLRPQAQTPYLEPCELTVFPSTPSTYITCADDRLVRPDWSRKVAAARLGATLVEVAGSHSPFLSRPADLAAVLLADTGP